MLTGSGVIAYPGLERRAEVVEPPRHYRILLEADFYHPFYRATAEGIEFDAYPYNDANPPQVIVSQVQDVFLTPAPNYLFPQHIRVLRGVVVDPAGGKVGDALVTEGARERVLTDAQGAFALPLRWVQQNTPILINAEHPRTGGTGMIQVLLPAAIGRNQTIPIY